MQSGPFQCDGCGALFAVPVNEAQARQLKHAGGFDCPCDRGWVSDAHRLEVERMRATLREIRTACRAAMGQRSVRDHGRRMETIEAACTFGLTGRRTGAFQVIDGGAA